jgi:hypothetical protein
VFAKVSGAKAWIDQTVCQESVKPPSKCSKKKKKRSRRLRPSDKEDEVACSDTEDLFDVSDDVEDKDCAWLALNRHTTPSEEDLCDHPYIALKCPKTCQVCDLLNEKTGLLDYPDDDYTGDLEYD